MTRSNGRCGALRTMVRTPSPMPKAAAQYPQLSRQFSFRIASYSQSSSLPLRQMRCQSMCLGDAYRTTVHQGATRCAPRPCCSPRMWRPRPSGIRTFWGKSGHGGSEYEMLMDGDRLLLLRFRRPRASSPCSTLSPRTLCSSPPRRRRTPSSCCRSRVLLLAPVVALASDIRAGGRTVRVTRSQRSRYWNWRLSTWTLSAKSMATR